MLEIDHKNNVNFGEFFAHYNGEKAGVLQYEWTNALTFNIAHTEVEQKFGGRSIGKQLVSAAVDFARKDGKKITATCSFAKSVLEKDDSVADVFI